MTLNVRLGYYIESADGQKELRWRNHDIPLQNVESFGDFVDHARDTSDTLLVMKSGIEYRIGMHPDQFKMLYDHWASKAIVYIPQN